MRQFALSDAARGKLNCELAHHKSRQRLAATTAFVVAPKAQCTTEQPITMEVFETPMSELIPHNRMKSGLTQGTQKTPTV
jgi:hypothetical protein